MIFRNTALFFLALTASSASAFTAPNPVISRTSAIMMADVAESADAELAEIALDKKRVGVNYQAGKADTDFARRFGDLAGKDIKTVGQAFADFTTELGISVNALYKNMVTDIVGTTHLVVVNARFQRDPLWSLGIMTTLDLLLKNYPEVEVRAQIKSALFKSVGIDEDDVVAEAKTISDWAAGKSKEDIEAALTGEGGGPLADIAAGIKKDEFWMYSRYFGIGLVKLMDNIGMTMDKDEVYPVMEEWMTNKLGKSHLTACADSDLYFKIRDKLEMMETMMKEIEIREKKRMAERLEDKAEAALRAADREGKLQDEIASEAKEARDRAAAKE